ncbi:sigma-70 family RNA polymerase sigma factor [Streptomyces sp. NPDC096030]|uniref:sigma-70 family RNA polymerase sigma factor n=1 Tax=Streptomyces sp. NPDC096030 TaxID=3155423 RepID=UPI0033223690
MESEEITEEQAARMLAAMNEVIRAGEEMRRLRAEMIKVFVGYGWTQDRIARLTELSQPAVSKQVRARSPEAPMALSLRQDDAPWLEGRLWGLAEAISESCGETAHCTPYVHAFARGRKRFTPRTVDELRRLVEEDLRTHPDRLPAIRRTAYRTAYDEISRGLDVPAKAPAARPAPSSATPSMRRTLAHQLQRERLRTDG